MWWKPNTIPSDVKFIVYCYAFVQFFFSKPLKIMQHYVILSQKIESTVLRRKSFAVILGDFPLKFLFWIKMNL